MSKAYFNILFTVIVFHCTYAQCEHFEETRDEQGIAISVSEKIPETKLVLVHVVVRHGERIPDPSEMRLFPRSSQVNSTFYPYGLSALTNRGKYRNFELGEFLRSRYGADNFLNSVYLTEELNAYTDDYPRTKMTLLGMLAGLYPPGPVQQYDPCLCWQPIPYDTLPGSLDEALYPFINCPRLWEAFAEVTASPEFLDHFAPYNYLYKEVSEQGGGNVTTLLELTVFYNAILGLKNYGVPQPEWVSSIMDDLHTASDFFYMALAHTNEMIKISAGPLLNTIVENCRAAINGTKPGPGKLRLLSLHATNIAVLLGGTHTIFPRVHTPVYCSALAIELSKHHASGEYGVTIMYLRQAGSDLPPLYLEIEGCGVFCPFDRFVEIVSRYLVTLEEIKRMC